MRAYMDDRLHTVVCNRCGKRMTVENGILKEGCFHGKQKFDYFSENDGMIQEFDLCEACYRAFVDSFLLPVSQREETELL